MDNKAWWEQNNSTSDFLKLEKGQTRVRIMSKFERVNQLFVGVFPNSKYAGMVDDNYVPKEGEKVGTQGWAWVLVREKDGTGGEFKIAQFGKAILGKITEMKSNIDWAFDGFPMPYDLTISNSGEGADRYSVLGSPRRTEVAKEEMDGLLKKKSIADIIGAIKAKKAGGEADKAFDRINDYPESTGDPKF